MIVPLGWHGQSPQPAFRAFRTTTRRGSGKSLNRIKQSALSHVMFVCLLLESLLSGWLVVVQWSIITALTFRKVINESLFFACDITT